MWLGFGRVAAPLAAEGGGREAHGGGMIIEVVGSILVGSTSGVSSDSTFHSFHCCK